MGGADQAQSRLCGRRHRASPIEAAGASVVLEAWDRLLDLAIETWLWVLDRLAPLPVSIVR
jgi:hypothetical protein